MTWYCCGADCSCWSWSVLPACWPSPCCASPSSAGTAAMTWISLLPRAAACRSTLCRRRRHCPLDRRRRIAVPGLDPVRRDRADAVGQDPDTAHWMLGVDAAGREGVSLLMSATLTTLLLAALATLVCLLSASGRRGAGARLDRTFAPAAAVALLPSALAIGLVVSGLSAPGYSTIVLGMVVPGDRCRRTRDQPRNAAAAAREGFVTAARLAGLTPSQQRDGRVLPHVLPRLVAFALDLLASAILVEVSLWFPHWCLRAGSQPGVDAARCATVHPAAPAVVVAGSGCGRPYAARCWPPQRLCGGEWVRGSCSNCETVGISLSGLRPISGLDLSLSEGATRSPSCRPRPQRQLGWRASSPARSPQAPGVDGNVRHSEQVRRYLAPTPASPISSPHCEREDLSLLIGGDRTRPGPQSRDAARAARRDSGQPVPWHSPVDLHPAISACRS